MDEKALPKPSPGESERGKACPRFGRGPRRASHGSKLERLEAIAALDRDTAFLSLREEDRRILRVGVVEFGDARLTFFPSLAKWSLAAGVSRATVGRVVKRAREAGVLMVTPHLRPPSASRLGQTSSTYRIVADPNKVSHDGRDNKVSHVADLNKVSHGETPGKASQHGETPEPDLTPSGVKSGETSLEDDRVEPDGSPLDHPTNGDDMQIPETLDDALGELAAHLPADVRARAADLWQTPGGRHLVTRAARIARQSVAIDEAKPREFVEWLDDPFGESRAAELEAF